MFKFLNFCRGLIETDASPHARFLRTSLITKLKDAYKIFAGDWELGRFHEGSYLPNHIGLLDFVALGIPAALLIFSRRLNQKYDNWALKIFLYILNFPFQLARFLLAAALVFNPLSLFIIGILHLISEYAAGGAALKKQVVDYMTHANETTDQVNAAELATYKEQHEKQGDQFSIEALEVSTRNSGKITFYNHHTSFLEYTPSIFQEPATEKSLAFEKALLTLNCVDITRRIEEEEGLERYQPLLKCL